MARQSCFILCVKKKEKKEQGTLCIISGTSLDLNKAFKQTPLILSNRTLYRRFIEYARELEPVFWELATNIKTLSLDWVRFLYRELGLTPVSRLTLQAYWPANRVQLFSKEEFIAHDPVSAMGGWLASFSFQPFFFFRLSFFLFFFEPLYVAS